MGKISLSVNAISPRDWQRFSPYPNFTNYDGYYLRLANKLFDYLNGPKSGLRVIFQREHLKTAALLATRHFEDFVNEIGLWAALRRKNTALYGRPLPFYDLEDYDPDCLNPQDFAYLLWHSLCKSAQKALNPFGPPLLEAADHCFAFFEAQLGKAFSTDFYDVMLTFDEGVHFFRLKQKLTWLALHSYLLGPEFGGQLEATLEAQKDMLQRFEDPGKIVYMLTEDYLFTQRSAWCALTTAEWLAEIARCPDGLREDLRQLGKRVMGNFLYEGHDARFYRFRFMQSWRLFDVRRESVDLNLETMRPGIAGGMLALIEWRGEHWLSGSFIGQDYSPEEIDRERISYKNVSFHAWPEDKQQRIREISAEMEEAFIGYFGSRLVFFPSEKAMAEALGKQQKWWNKNKTTPRDPKDPPSRFAKLLDAAAKPFSSVEISGSNDKAAAFFEPGTGMMMSVLVPKLAQRLSAKNLSPQEANELFFSFFKECTPALAAELAQRFGTENLRFPVMRGDAEFTRKNCLLFQHFYGPDNFGEAVPLLTLLPED